MNPLLERSRRKLAEAAFFLRYMSETKGHHPEFGYYMSAFLSAVRSIGFVIQADLRRSFGPRFEVWWESARLSMPAPRVPFAVIAERRNQALKVGELLPGVRVVIRLEHPAVEEVVLTVDLRGGRIVTKSKEYKFRPGGEPTLHLADPNDSEALLEQLVPLLKPILDSLDADEPAFTISEIGYELHRTLPAVTFDEMIRGFQEHVSAMEEIVSDADHLFAIDCGTASEPPGHETA
jgi:hypothetical protein